VKYLQADEILLIHSMVVDETSGSHGVRDTRAVMGLVESPKQSFGGNELYPTIFEKAAVYARDILMLHPFIDGNKRTGMVASSIFLENNGYDMATKEGEIETYAVRIVTEKLEIKDIANWFKQHSKKVRR
jgi:death-on-curing protein